MLLFNRGNIQSIMSLINSSQVLYTDVTIYRTDIIPSKNMIVESISTYLSNITSSNKIDIPRMQYIRNGLDISIKLDSTYASAFKTFSPNKVTLNYVRLQTINNATDLSGNVVETFYYFITKITELASETIKLDLSMDTLNTFESINLLAFDKKTNILRQHGNRFKNIATEVTPVYKPIVDTYSEGIQVNKYKISDTIINDKTQMRKTFYIGYRNTLVENTSTPSNPIQCLLFCKEQLTFKTGSGTGSKTYTGGQLTNGWYYITSTGYTSGIVSYKRLGVTSTFSLDPTSYQGEDPNCSYVVIYFHLQQNTATGHFFTKFSVALYDASYNFLRFYHDEPLVELDTEQITFYDIEYAFFKTQYEEINYENLLQYKTKVYFNRGLKGEHLNALENVNRYDSRWIKIIALPYSPVGIDYNSGTSLFTYDTNYWTYTSDGFLSLNDLSIDLSNTRELIANLNVPSTPTSFDPQNDLRNDVYETKLWNSDFTSQKLVYDSFSAEIPLELYTYVPSTINVRFKPSNLVNSNFLFWWTLKEDNYSIPMQYENLDFSEVLLTRRNNEVILYNSEYLNYLKYGYNFDKKAQVRSNTQNAVQTGLISAGTIATASLTTAKALSVTSSYTGPVGALVSAVAWIIAGTSILISTYSTINKAIESQESIDRKLSLLNSQAISLSGSDDFDLMEKVTSNRLHFMVYKPLNSVLKPIKDLFYYCGYAHQTQEVPNTNSRIWFNFLQCDPIFTNEKDRRIIPYLEDIKERFKMGVTYYHRYIINGSAKYDFEQIKENWESMFFPDE